MDDADRVEVVVVAVATAVLTIPAATTTIIVANTTRGAPVTMRLFFLFLLRCLISLSNMKIMDKRLPLRAKGKSSYRTDIIIIIIPILGNNEGKDHDYEVS